MKLSYKIVATPQVDYSLTPAQVVMKAFVQYTMAYPLGRGKGMVQGSSRSPLQAVRDVIKKPYANFTKTAPPSTAIRFLQFMTLEEVRQYSRDLGFSEKTSNLIAVGVSAALESFLATKVDYWSHLRDNRRLSPNAATNELIRTATKNPGFWAAYARNGLTIGAVVIAPENIEKYIANPVGFGNNSPSEVSVFSRLVGPIVAFIVTTPWDVINRAVMMHGESVREYAKESFLEMTYLKNKLEPGSIEERSAGKLSTILARAPKGETKAPWLKGVARHAQPLLTQFPNELPVLKALCGCLGRDPYDVATTLYGGPSKKGSFLALSMRGWQFRGAMGAVVGGVSVAGDEYCKYREQEMRDQQGLPGARVAQMRGDITDVRAPVYGPVNFVREVEFRAAPSFND